jgi:hypothetical protein
MRLKEKKEKPWTLEYLNPPIHRNPGGGPRLDRFNKSLCRQFQFELDFCH